MPDDLEIASIEIMNEDDWSSLIEIYYKYQGTVLFYEAHFSW